MSSYAETALVRSLGYLAESQQAIAHNMANISSTGFKRRQPVAAIAESRFHSMLAQQLPTVQYTEHTDWSAGNLIATREPSHVAIQSGDFFRVRATDGRTFFTRSGELQVDAQGFLTDESGHRYLDSNGTELQLGTSADDIATFTISPDGTLTNARTGESLNKAIGLFRPSNRDSLLPIGNGLWVEQTPQDVTVAPGGSLRQGHVEASNVDSVGELVNMLVVQRTFDATATVLKSIGQLHGSFVASTQR